jgi:hypothetical protein
MVPSTAGVVVRIVGFRLLDIEDIGKAMAEA